MPKSERLEATALLKKDHEAVKTLLEKLQKTSEKSPEKRTALLDQIHVELEAHMHIEQEIFYPAVREALANKEGEKMYFEAIEEHKAAAVVLNDALEADPSSPSFSGKAKVLSELILHHANEEEKEMFPKARKALSLEQRRQLAEQMTQMKQGELAGAA
jgi:hemerythrin superfamily protein